MDPDATLNEIRESIEEFDVTPYSEDAAAVADSVIEKFKALDAWLSSGGFLPRSWDLSVKRGVGGPPFPPNHLSVVPEPVEHEEIWCDRCAWQGDHNFVTNTNGTVNCLCCGKEKS